MVLFNISKIILSQVCIYRLKFDAFSDINNFVDN